MALYEMNVDWSKNILSVASKSATVKQQPGAEAIEARDRRSMMA
jgi:hypothetical protein